MNILFLTLSRITDIRGRGIYTDLIREFVQHGHQVHIVIPMERRFKQSVGVFESDGVKILRVKTLNIQKSHVIEKGFATLLLEFQYQHAIQKHWGDVKFDLLLYSTPPITFNKVIASVKKRCNAKTYLLLKDIFPQNAVDLSMFSKNSLLYKLFRRKEERLYELSDYIGCMSPANCDYILSHNKTVETRKVEVCPNCIELVKQPYDINDRGKLLTQLNIPTDKTLFIYGGNLGRPQGIDFLIEVIAVNETFKNSYFVVVGSGTEFIRMQQWFDNYKPNNACLLANLPKIEYDQLVKICDVGLIFLDKRFTIPNYPSRLLSYLESRMPVLMATDINTDIGSIAENNGYGWWTESGNIEIFMERVEKLAIDKVLCKHMGENGYQFLKDNYTIDKGYQIIMKHFDYV